MSRSNSKTAYLLRETESVKVKRAILKASNYADIDVFNTLGNSNSQYEDKLANLLKFSSKNKKTTKISSHKSEWLNEQSRLRNLSEKVESSVGSSLQTMLLLNPTDDAILSIADSLECYYKERKNNESEIINQLHLLKEMLRHSVRVKTRVPAKTTFTTSLTDAKDEATTQNSVNSIIAELLLKLRQDHSKAWQSLQLEETKLRAELSQMSVSIGNMLHLDRIETQDEHLRNEFSSIMAQVETCDAEFNDSCNSKCASEGKCNHSVLNSNNSTVKLDLEVIMEEAMRKIVELDNIQKLSLIEREKEKTLFCSDINIHPYAGWTSTEHDIFVKVYRKAQVTGMLRKQMMDLLVTQLGGANSSENSLCKTIEDIHIHEEWYRKMKHIHNKYKDGDAVYVTTRQDIIQQTKQDMINHQTKLREEAEHEKELLLHEQHRAMVHTRLNELREQKEELTIKQQEEQQVLEQQLAKQMKEQEEKILQERMEKKAQLELFKQMKEAAESERLALQAAQIKEAQMQLKEMIERNRPLVALRTQLSHEKEEKRKQKEVSHNP